jgi:gliding motility-associated-like protein
MLKIFKPLMIASLFFCTQAVYSQIVFDLPDIDTVPGSTICVDFVVAEDIDVFTMQFSINFDPDVLQFEEVTGFNLSSLSPSNFGIANAPTGVISFSWFDFSASPVFIPGGTSIFEVCFTLVGNAGDMSTVEITGTPTPIEITESLLGINVGLEQTGGEVVIGGPTIIQLSAPDAFIEENSSVCLDITSSFFENISSLQTSITWDPSVIQLDSVSNILLDSLELTDFDFTDIASGVLTLDWSTSAPDGVTLPNGSILFALCFTSVGNLGDASDLSFEDDPVVTQATATNSPLVEVVPFNGVIRISTPLNIFADVQTEDVGTEFCVDVRVSDFIQLLSIQFSMQWDTAVLQFDTIQNLGVQWLDFNSFGFADIDEGILTLSWFDFDFSCESLADSSVLFQLCFEAIGEDGQCSTIEFVDEPTLIEVISCGDTPVGMVSTPGEVCLESVIKIVDTLITGVNCLYPDTGAIDITVFGGEGPYTFLWNTGDTLEDISGLFNGTYSVLITDSADPANSLLATFMVPGDFSVPMANAGPDTLIDCDIIPIQLFGDGSTGGPYTYEWGTNNGKIDSLGNTLTPFVSLPGTYFLIVKDSTNGCAALDQMVVTGVLDFPEVEAGPTQFITCANAVTVMDGTGSDTGSAFIYQWQTSDGNILADGNTLTPLVDSAGTYQLIVTDTTNGCSASDEALVQYNFLTAEADAGSDTTLTCQDTSIVLNGTSSAGFAFVPEWYTTDGNICDGGATLQPCVNAEGTYCLVVSNIENGCKDTSCINVVFDTIPPVADAGPQGIINCNSNIAVLDGTASSSGPEFSYQWIALSGGEIISGANTLNPQVSAEAVYELRVTNILTGCRSIDTVSVTADPNIPQVNAGNDTTLTCNNSEIQLNALNSDSGPDFVNFWSTTDGTITGGGNTLTPTVNEDGTYILTITNIVFGCSAVSAVEVTFDTLPPLADAGGNKEITCINPAPVLNGSNSATGPNISYLWTTDDGAFVAGTADTTAFASVEAVGTYTLTVTNEATGCVASDDVLVTLSVDLPVAVVSPDTNITCSHDTVLLTGAGSQSGAGISYFWSSDVVGGIVSDEESLEVQVALPGEYTLAVVDANNCFTQATVMVGIDTIPPQVDSIYAEGIIDCDDPEVQLFADAFAGGPLEYLWTTAGGEIPAGQETLPSPNVGAGGVYDVVLTDVSNGCTASGATLVEADTIAPDVFDVPDDELTCDEDLLTLDATGSTTGADFIQEWTTSGGNILSDPNMLMVDVDDDGEYYFTVTDTTNGCFSIDTVAIAIDTISPTVFIANPDEITCDVLSSELDASNSSSGPEYEYEWAVLVPGNITGPLDQLTTQVDAGGTYELLITNMDNGCTSSSTIEVVSDTLSPVAIAGQDDDLGCDPNPLELDGAGSSTGGQITYEWTSSQGTILSGASTLTPTIDGAGTYVLLVTNNANGCTQTDEVQITQLFQLEDPNAGTDDVFCDGDSITLAAIATDSALGIWTSPTGAQFDDPQSPDAGIIAGLQPGENIFIWTLSTADCPDYAQDTVVFMVEQAPQANNDGMMIDFGEGTYRLNIIDNDILTGVGDFDVNLVSQPDPGSAQYIGNGEVSFSAPGDFTGPISFIYEICNDNDLCPDLCDEATITFILGDRPIINPDSLGNLPNTITPNGDGLNDRLIFDFLDINPEQFDDNEIVIFNRWGDILYEAGPYRNEWDGTTEDGNELPEGTYYYILRLKVPDGNIIRGDVTILR